MVQLGYNKEYEDQCSIVKEFFHQGLPGNGVYPFFLNECRHLRCALKWSPSMRHEGKSFDSLLPDDQDVVVKLLAIAPLDAQVVISEFVHARIF